MPSKQELMKSHTDAIEADAMIVPDATRQVTQTSFVTAMRCQCPRDKEAVLEQALQEFRLGADGMYYRWTVKSKDGPKVVEGISIQGAMVLAREWGNCTYQIALAGESKSSWMFEATFIDLEKGAAFPRLYQQNKGRMGGNYDEQRGMDMVFQRGQSMAIRNAVLAGMPEWLKRRSFDAATGAVKDEAGPTLRQSLEKCAQSFRALGVSVEQLEVNLDKRHDDWTSDDLVTLRGLYAAVKDGQVSLDDIFPKERAPGEEG